MAMATPEFLQTKTYAAMRLRQVFLDLPVQEGVVSSGDLKVAQRAAGGANLSVDIAAGSAFVQGDTTSRQGLYHAYNDGLVNLAIGNNTSGNPRLDQIVCRVYDSQDGLSGADQATLEVIPGSATAGATLDNRSGAAALPFSAMRVADVLVASGASSIVNSNIRDRRPWARGARGYIEDSTSGSIALSATVYTLAGILNNSIRLETSGHPVRVRLGYTSSSSAAVVHITYVGLFLDGQVDPTNVVRWALNHQNVAAATATSPVYEWVLPSLAAGSHIFYPGFKVSTGSTSIDRNAIGPVWMSVEEIFPDFAVNL